MDSHDYNVIIVDWGLGAKYFKSIGFNEYPSAAANTQVVGAMLANFIHLLVQYKDADVQKMHLIGHSLGSHVAGFAGQRFVKKKIRRITG